MPAVVHFEIPADDVEKAKKFYATLFGWEFSDVPDMDYSLISTGSDVGINGGIIKKRDPRQTVVNYVDVPSVEEFAAKVEELGGRVVIPKTAVKENGYFMLCLDPENNHFGLWEDDPEAL